MKKFFKNVKLLDIAFLGFVTFIIILSSLIIYSSNNDSLYLLIKTPYGSWVYPLEEDVKISVKGKIGEVSIQIKEGEASVIKSNCPTKTCIASPVLKKRGDWNACLPNKVFLSVEQR